MMKSTRHFFPAFICIMMQLLPIIMSAQNTNIAQPTVSPGNSLWFTENKGQIINREKHLCPDILFKSRSGGTEIYIRDTGVSFVLNNISDVMEDIDEDIDDGMKNGSITVPKSVYMQEHFSTLAKREVKVHRIDLDFVHANRRSEIITGKAINTTDNFYFPHCPQGITKVRSFDTVTLRNIYTGIDVEYMGDKEQGLKYNIIVNPEADASQISLKYSGAETISMHNESLYIATSLGYMFDFSPKVYQHINGRDLIIPFKYEVSYPSKGEAVIGFKLGAYDSKYALIIDPWITYYGGSSNEYGMGIDTDPNGNIVFTGQTQSPDFPVSSGAFQTTISSLSNVAFAVKMSASDTRIFGTYIGGSVDDMAWSICADNQSNIYIAGYTGSSDFPIGATVGNVVHQNSIGADSVDAFLIKLDPSGARLWSTFYGGGDMDYANGVVVDKATNDIIICGITNSLNNISTAGSYQTTNNGNGDAFVAKFSSNGTRIWGTYLGGQSGDNCSAVACDQYGNIFVSGSTYLYGSSLCDFPVVAGHQMIFGGTEDAFLSKINPAGTSLIWSTFYGGINEDWALSVSVDNAENVIIGGCTRSANDISTTSSFQPSISGNDDGFLAKFDNNGLRLWATYLGGSTNTDQGISGLRCDADNNIITSGDTYCTDFPVTSCAFQKVFKGSEDQFISTFRSDGSLMCSGYLGLGVPGSPDNETYQTQCIAVSDCFVYLCAFTECNYPVTPGAFQTSCVSGKYTTAIAKLYYNTCGGVTTSLDFTGNDTICARISNNFHSLFISCDSSTTTYSWSFPGGNPSSSNEISPVVTYNVPGDYDVLLVVNQHCGSDSILKSNYMHVSECNPSTLDVPNVITPNGDGYNDDFHVKYAGKFKNYKVMIFNRWGNSVYDSDNIDGCWKCGNCSDGTYFYVITASGEDKKDYDLHGTITVMH